MTRQRIFGAKETDLFFSFSVGFFKFFIDEDRLALVDVGTPRQSKSSFEGEEARKLVGMTSVLLII